MAIPKPSTAPAFQFYPRDFLSSTKVQRMSLTERGIYITLLSHCWLDGSLPSDLKKIAGIVGMKPAQFARIWENVLVECFYERSGKLQNDRLDLERKKQADFRRRQSDAAALRWDKRRKSAGHAPDVPGNALQSSSSSSSANKKDQEREGAAFSADTATDGQALFGRLVTAYPESRRTSDHPSMLAFIEALGPSHEQAERFALMLATLEAHKASDQWRRGVVPNLITWLKRGDWRGSRKLALAATGTEGRGRTGAAPAGKYDGIEEE